MRLQVRRLGGFAGARIRAEVETSKLPAGESEAAEAAVRRLAGKAPAGPPQPDRFRYEITPLDEPDLAPFVLDEHDLPHELAGVIRAASESGEIERPQR